MATTNKHVKAVIQLRRATEQEWIDVNPILREGEPALSTDKNKLKIGNGSLHWSEIPYMAGSGGEGGKDYYAGNGLRLNDTIFSIDTAVVAELEDLPTRLSELENDSGFISDFTETDPIFSTSAAANITSEDITSWNDKSDFSGSYEDLTNKPTIPVVPTNISDFNNDVGYITDYTETDPTVPSWAKAPNKPIYTANEVGALPDDTVIPSKVSDLDNDSGFITNYTETDPIFVGSAAYDITANDITNWNNKSDFSGSYNDLTDKPTIPVVPTNISAFNNDVGYITGFTETDPTVPAWAKQPTKPTYTAEDVGALPDDTFIPETLGDLDNDVGYISSIVTDLGHFDMEEYGWDFWTYLEDKTENGFYKVNDDQDGFDYFFRIERTNNQVYQEWWYEEEGALNRYVRYGWLNGDEWEWNDTTNWVTDEQLSANCYQKWQTYTKQEVDNLLANKADSSILGNYYTDSEVDNILENNYYTIDQVDDLLEGFAPNNMIEITWANLKTLRDSSQLVKGAWYRITDYNFITTKLGLQSGDHPFDIVLLAISESMLSESGYACRHAGDHYFEREVTEGGIEWLYTVYADDYAENYGDEAIDHSDDIHSVDAFCDSDVRPHPGTGDDVPVLFKTNIEEYTIDEPDYDDAYFYEGTYDLDGDEYDMWSKYEQDPDTGDWVFMQQYALTPIVVENGELEVSPIPETKLVPVNMNAWELKYCLDNDKDLFDWASTDGKGVIYYLKDEFGNEAPYDFKNVMFQRKNITSVSSNILSVFMQGENSRLGLPNNYTITCGNNNYYYYTFDTPYNAGNDSSLFGDSAYNIIKPYIMDGQRHINNIVLGIANNNNIGNNCFDLTLWGTVRDNNLTYNCSNLLMVGLTQSTLTYVRSSTFFSLGATTFGSGCSQNIGNMLTNSEIGDSCNNSNFGTGNMGIKMGSGCSNNTFGTYSYNNTFENGVSNCTFGNYCSYNVFEKSVQSITLPNYTRYCKFETAVSRITFTTTGGSNSSYIQYVTVCRGISNLSVAPTRNRAYEQIYYKTGRTETEV